MKKKEYYKRLLKVGKSSLFSCVAFFFLCAAISVCFPTILQVLVESMQTCREWRAYLSSSQYVAVISQSILLVTAARSEAMQQMPMCDFSSPRSIVCEIDGEVRTQRNSSTVFFLNPTLRSTDNTSWKIKPYARKNDPTAMENVREVTLKALKYQETLPPCSVRRDVPAVVFSLGGYAGDYFHSYTDVLIPLFLTANHFNGEVQFLISDISYKWVDMFGHILRQLSKYEIIDLNKMDTSYCFPKAYIGLVCNQALGIDPNVKVLDRYYSLKDFKSFLLKSYSLPRRLVPRLENPRRPRLLIIAESGSRKLLNQGEVANKAKDVGFDVVVPGEDLMSSLSNFTEIVNSCNVIVGVHGANLANMLYLPAGAMVIQIVPYGDLNESIRYFFRTLAMETELKYLDYEVTMEECSLIQNYGKEDTNSKDPPNSYHKLGKNVIEDLNLKHDLRIHLVRFERVLIETLNLLQQPKYSRT